MCITTKESKRNLEFGRVVNKEDDCAYVLQCLLFITMPLFFIIRLLMIVLLISDICFLRGLNDINEFRGRCVRSLFVVRVTFSSFSSIYLRINDVIGHLVRTFTTTINER